MPVASVRFTGGWRRALDRAQPARLCRAALAVLMLGAAAFLLFETRHTTLWFDEWDWALGRRGNSVGTFLRPHNSHLSLVPLVIYRQLFATAGIRSYLPYRILGTVGHLGCVVLLYVYAERRIGSLHALLAAALLLFFGPGWQDILWPFQISWLISIAAGIGALMALERRTRGGDVTACVLLVVGVFSSSVGVAVLAGAILEVVWDRRRWADAWIVATPLVLYALWSLGYQQTTLTLHDFLDMPYFVANAGAGALSALLGLSGDTTTGGAATLLVWGAPLAVAALAMLAWRLRMLGRLPLRVAVPLAIVLAFWLLSGTARASTQQGFESRYLYVSAVFILLAAIELGRGVRPHWAISTILAVVATGAVIANIGIFREAGNVLRGYALAAHSDLAALDIVEGHVPAGYTATHFPGYPDIVVTAGPYAAMRAAIGTPAYTSAQLADAPDPDRALADSELIHADGVGLIPAQPGSPALGLSNPPVLDARSGGTVTSRDGCITFQSGISVGTGSGGLQVTVPSRGVLIRAANVPASVSVRRFAQSFQAIGTVPAGESATIQIAADNSTVPWHVQVTVPGRASVCGL